MPEFDFMKLSVDEQDKLLKGHGRFVGACGHTLMNCRCPGERTTVPLMIRCAECDDSVSEDDIYEAVKGAREGFQKQALFGMLGIRKKPDSGSRGVAVLDPPSFEQYIKSINLEPIDKVRERFEKTKQIDEMIRYMQSGQQDQDLNRLSFETGYVKSPAGEVIVNENPQRLRSSNRSYVNKFYQGLEDKLPSKQLDPTPMMRAKLAACLGAFSVCLRDTSFKHSERLAALSMKISPVMVRQKAASDRLKKLSKKLEGYPSYVQLMERIAEELDHSRKTTKNDPPIAELLRKSTGNLVDFMKKINEMAEPDNNDTYRDLLIKRVYRAFLHDLQLKKIDTSEEIAATNKPADKLIAEIEMAAKPTESLIHRIEKYERKFTK